MATFMLDTCVLSELSKVSADRRVAAWIQAARNVVVPVAAATEIERGIHVCKSTRRSSELSSWFENLIRTGIRFMDTDLDVARQYGRMMARPELRRFWEAGSASKPPGQDLHIAAAAITKGYVVATFDTADFMFIHRHFPLPGLFNPLTSEWSVRPSGSEVAPAELRPPGQSDNLPTKSEF